MVKWQGSHQSRFVYVAMLAKRVLIAHRKRKDILQFETPSKLMISVRLGKDAERKPAFRRNFASGTTATLFSISVAARC